MEEASQASVHESGRLTSNIDRIVTYRAIRDTNLTRHKRPEARSKSQPNHANHLDSGQTREDNLKQTPNATKIRQL